MRHSLRRSPIVVSAKHSIWLAGLAFALTLMWVEPAAAAGMLLEDVLITRVAEHAEIEVRLRCSYRYVEHFPARASNRSEVRLAALGGCNESLSSGVLRDARRPAGRELASLDEIELSTPPGGDATLILSFFEPVSVRVRQRGDLRSLLVTVTPANGQAFGEQLETAAPVAVAKSPAPRVAPTLTTAQRERAEQRAVQAMRAPAVKEEPGDYAINLESSIEPIGALDPRVSAPPAGRSFYLSRTDVEGRTWHRLRLGFFATEDDAERMRQELLPVYPRAWITRIAEEEHATADSATLAAALPEPEPVAITASAPAPDGVPTLEPERFEALLAEARTAMLADNYDRAIQIYMRVLREPDNAYSRDALEYLALARERNGQKAHAVAEYRRFLELYPDDVAAARVRQRLAGLTAVTAPTRSTGRRAARRPAESRWEVYGGLAQYYRRDQSQINDQDSVVSQSSLLTDVDVLARRRGERTLFSSRATFGNLYDLLGEDEGAGSDTRVYYLYADLLDDLTGLGARLGRQSLRTGGVPGRFDGAHLSWQWRPDMRLNFMTGYPVDSTSEDLASGRMFYGVSVDLLEIMERIDLSLFVNMQDNDGLSDREAIGADLRYFDASRSLVATLDYDTSYSELNSLTILGNWSFESRLTLNALIDQRKSPFLTTRNALIGQPVSTMGELLQIFSEDEIRRLAVDRTGEMTAITLGASMPLFDRFQINADVTRSDYSGTQASGGVAEVPDFGTEYYYSLNLIGSSLLKQGDSSIIGLRYTDGATASTTSLYFDTRYPVTRGLRINPRIRLSWREFDLDGSTEWRAAPAIRLYYRFARHYSIELETGGEWSSRELAQSDTDYSAFFIYAGYRADF